MTVPHLQKRTIKTAESKLEEEAAAREIPLSQATTCGPAPHFVVAAVLSSTENPFIWRCKRRGAIQKAPECGQRGAVFWVITPALFNSCVQTK